MTRSVSALVGSHPDDGSPGPPVPPTRAGAIYYGDRNAEGPWHRPGVRTESLNPDIVVIKSAKDRA
jgi:hypothetical protein